MSKKVRIKDIASGLGLSSTLVSLVLNNKADQHGIKPETQQKVIALARKMGYYLDEEVEERATIKKTGPGVIGMVVSSLKDPFVIELSDHMRTAFESLGYGFSTVSWNSDDPKFKSMVSGLKRMYSGVVLTGDAADESLIRSLKAAEFPFVVLEKSKTNMRLNLVRSDCTNGASKLAAHLAPLNYKRIAILSSKSESAYIKDKIDCFVEGIKNEIPGIVFEYLTSEASLVNLINEDKLSELVRPPRSVQAIVVTESFLVFPLISSLRKLRVRIPADIALISLEDGPGFDLLDPPVTRLRRDISGMASKVVSILWTEIKNSGRSKYKRTVNVNPELIVGRSCGATGK